MDASGGRVEFGSRSESTCMPAVSADEMIRVGREDSRRGTAGVRMRCGLLDVCQWRCAPVAVVLCVPRAPPG